MDADRSILQRDLLISLALNGFLVIISVPFFRGSTDIGNKKKINFKKPVLKTLYTKVLPIFIILIALYVATSSLVTYLNPKFTDSSGVLNSISFSSRNFKQFSVKIDNKIYVIPNGVAEPDDLKKGGKYEFTYTEKRNVIVKISEVNN